MFLTKQYKIISFFKRQNYQKTTNTALVVCSMVVTFLQQVYMCMIPKLLYNHPDWYQVRSKTEKSYAKILEYSQEYFQPKRLAEKYF